MSDFASHCRSLCLPLLASLILVHAHIATRGGNRTAPGEAVRRDAAATTEDCTSADEIFAEATRLRSEWKNETLLVAVNRYEVAGRCWQASGDAARETDALLNLGEVYSVLSNLQKARASYEEALKLTREKRDQVREIAALNGLSLVFVHLDLDKALGYGNESLALSQRLKDKRGEAYARNNLGFALYFQSDLSGALENLNQALTLARSLEDHLLLGNVLLNMGYVRNDAGELEVARDLYQQALPHWQAAHNLRGLSRTLTAIGGVEISLGKVQEALEFQQQALKIAEAIGDVDGQGIIRNSVGYAYEVVGNDERALDLYLQALDHFIASRNRAGEAQTSQFVGKVYERLDNYTQARQYYLKCLSISRQLNDRLLEALALNSLGTLAQTAGETREALGNFKRALSIYRAAGNRSGEIVTLNNLGHLHATIGARPEAVSFYALSLPLALATGDRALEVVTRGRLAQVRRDMGRLDEARSQLEASLHTIETIRTKVISPELRASYLAATRDHYELYIDVLMQLHKQSPGQGLDAAAFRISELARARNLLDMLTEAHADIRQGISPELLEQERLLQSRLDRLAEQQMQLLAREHNSEQLQPIEREIRALDSDYQDLEAKIREQSPHYAALMRPQPISLEEIQRQVLDDQTLLLEYALGDERSYLWAATRTTVQSYQLPGRAEIARAVTELYGSLVAGQPVDGETFDQRQTRVARANEQLPGEIATLSRILLGPVGNLGAKRLLIVPDGALQYIPFQLLSAVDEPGPLVYNHEIVNEPSASALALFMRETRTRKPATGSVAVLADPVFEADDPRITRPAKPNGGSESVQESELRPTLGEASLSGARTSVPRLQASRDEADAIMSVTPFWSGFQALGFAANRATAMSTTLGDYRIIHLATHGLLNDKHPELSGIVLSMFDQNGRPQDGFLRLHDIYNLRLPVDLVVLSACNTALGKDVKGEGLIGLTRGFMYAGASSVVASLWKVDDEATAELMRLFYGNMLRDGLSPAAALRKAQVSMSQQKRWQSPYYWAGFVIQGQYLQSGPVSHFAIPRLAFWLLGALGVGTAVFFALKRRRKIIV